jgi:hypothetical protein
VLESAYINMINTLQTTSHCVMQIYSNKYSESRTFLITTSNTDKSLSMYNSSSCILITVISGRFSQYIMQYEVILAFMYLGNNSSSSFVSYMEYDSILNITRKVHDCTLSVLLNFLF